MELGVILPCTKLFGGVKRFLELGNIFVAQGHGFTVFTPDATPPDWFDYKGRLETLEAARESDLDALFVTELQYLELLNSSRARKKIYYHVFQNVDLRRVLAYDGIEVFANSSTIYEHDWRRYRITPFKAIGGVDTSHFTPSPPRKREGPTVILTYGRLNRKRKGTRFVVWACEKLYRQGHDIRLLLFDTPISRYTHELIKSFSCRVPFEFVTNHPVRQNNALFQRADIFASAEKHAGWSNTCAEAMAAGIPVVATESGTSDFLVHEQTGLVVRRSVSSIAAAIGRLCNDAELAQRLASEGRSRISQFSWQNCARQVLEFVQSEAPPRVTGRASAEMRPPSRLRRRIRDQRSRAQVWNHYLVEKELADRLKASDREGRSLIYRDMYDELFQRVPDHPRLRGRSDEEQVEERNRQKWALVAPYCRRSSVMVEFAPGDSRFAFHAAGRVAKVTGIDISRQSGDAQAPPNYTHITYDGYNLKLVDGYADVVFSDQLLEHIHPDDVPGHLALARRILRPGRVYVIRTPHAFYGPHDVSKHFSDTPQGFHLHEWTYTELGAALEYAGFSEWTGHIKSSKRYMPVSKSALRVREAFLAPLSRRMQRLMCPVMQIPRQMYVVGRAT